MPIDKFIGDAGGYDHAKTYETLTSHEKKTGKKHSISVVVPPNIGRTLRSKDTANQNTEVKIGVKILTRMKALGMPKARSVV